MAINYVIGDAIRPPVSTGTRIIAHICNDAGGWGAGFVLALSQRDMRPEHAYHKWSTEPDFQLGNIQMVDYVEPGLYCANMIAQHGFGKTTDGAYIPPVRYLALVACLRKLQRQAESYVLPVSIHMPRIGCGLGGGTWDQVEPLLNYFIKFPVWVYDLPVISLPVGPSCGPNGCTV